MTIYFECVGDGVFFRTDITPDNKVVCFRGTIAVLNTEPANLSFMNFQSDSNDCVLSENAKNLKCTEIIPYFPTSIKFGSISDVDSLVFGQAFGSGFIITGTFMASIIGVVLILRMLRGKI